MTPANGRAAAGGDQPMAAGRDQTRPKIRANQNGGEAAALSTGDPRRRRKRARAPRPQPTRPPDPSLEDRGQRTTSGQSLFPRRPRDQDRRPDGPTDRLKKYRVEKEVPCFASQILMVEFFGPHFKR